jgi:hypothetical protein
MRPILTALAAAATLAAVISASSGAGLVDDFVAGAIVGNATADERPAYVTAPDPGYIVYSGDAAALPGRCYWTRMPVYDSARTVIGWRGRPVAVCPPSRVSAGVAAVN